MNAPVWRRPGEAQIRVLPNAPGRQPGQNLADLLPAVTPACLRRTMLVTDDSHPEDLARTGHLNHLLRQAGPRGLTPGRGDYGDSEPG